MKKRDLLSFIDRAQRVEEEAVQSLAKHVRAATEWEGLSPSENVKVRDVLKTLERDSRSHYEALEQLKKHVVKEAKDVY